VVARALSGLDMFSDADGKLSPTVSGSIGGASKCVQICVPSYIHALICSPQQHLPVVLLLVALSASVVDPPVCVDIMMPCLLCDASAPCVCAVSGSSWPAAGCILCHLCGAPQADAQGGPLHWTDRWVLAQRCLHISLDTHVLAVPQLHGARLQPLIVVDTLNRATMGFGTHRRNCSMVLWCLQSD
jgi:hypothetical protein